RRTPRHALRRMDALAPLLRIDLRTGHVHLDSERTFVYEPRGLVAWKQPDTGADQGRYRRRAEFGIAQVEPGRCDSRVSNRISTQGNRTPSIPRTPLLPGLSGAGSTEARQMGEHRPRRVSFRRDSSAAIADSRGRVEDES